ncbi:hypothetical protein NDU88_006319 [Pleurodeles waltl]|uniref:Uncharacterized protein n=1 Tax=Pleurodeles waltl TaxID=8319 RepID=A0AAV7PHZ4_PLEWA|nr:hypothetical protein NDU88_006319 [Pleurodeles waltl]
MLPSKARSRGGGGKRGPKPRPKARESLEEYPLLGSQPCGDQAGVGEQAPQISGSGQEEASRAGRADRAARDNHERSSGTPLGTSIRDFVGRY